MSDQKNGKINKQQKPSPLKKTPSPKSKGVQKSSTVKPVRSHLPRISTQIVSIPGPNGSKDETSSSSSSSAENSRNTRQVPLIQSKVSPQELHDSLLQSSHSQTELEEKTFITIESSNGSVDIGIKVSSGTELSTENEETSKVENTNATDKTSMESTTFDNEAETQNDSRNLSEQSSEKIQTQSSDETNSLGEIQQDKSTMMSSSLINESKEQYDEEEQDEQFEEQEGQFEKHEQSEIPDSSEIVLDLISDVQTPPSSVGEMFPQSHSTPKSQSMSRNASSSNPEALSSNGQITKLSVETTDDSQNTFDFQSKSKTSSRPSQNGSRASAQNSSSIQNIEETISTSRNETSSSTTKSIASDMNKYEESIFSLGLPPIIRKKFPHYPYGVINPKCKSITPVKGCSRNDYLIKKLLSKSQKGSTVTLSKAIINYYTASKKLETELMSMQSSQISHADQMKKSSKSKKDIVTLKEKQNSHLRK